MPWPLHDYQRRAVDELRRLIALAVARIVIAIAMGGGKTRVAWTYIAEDVIPQGKRVLWVTLNWRLLRQAHRQLTDLMPQTRSLCGRVGGDDKWPELVENPDAQIVFTTVHTHYSRRGRREFGDRPFDVVIIDEQHWGEEKDMYDDLERRRSTAIIIGLTGTPRRWGSYQRACEVSFRELVDRGILARPIRKVVPTGIDWDAEVSSSHGDFTATSLGKLARSKPRNSLIVRMYRENAAKWGKTVVFAADIRHADALARRFREEGIGAAALHCALDESEQRRIEEAFRSSQLQVVVSVVMLIHGIDVPDIRTVILARPTTSDTLFMQMVGRGSRRAPGKDTFFVIDLVDNLRRHGDRLVTSDILCDGSSTHSDSPRTRVSSEQVHDIEPAPDWVFGDDQQSKAGGAPNGVNCSIGVDDIDPLSPARALQPHEAFCLRCLKVFPRRQGKCDECGVAVWYCVTHDMPMACLKEKTSYTDLNTVCPNCRDRLEKLVGT